MDFGEDTSEKRVLSISATWIKPGSNLDHGTGRRNTPAIRRMHMEFGHRADTASRLTLSQSPLPAHWRQQAPASATKDPSRTKRMTVSRSCRWIPLLRSTNLPRYAAVPTHSLHWWRSRTGRGKPGLHGRSGRHSNPLRSHPDPSARPFCRILQNPVFQFIPAISHFLSSAFASLPVMAMFEGSYGLWPATDEFHADRMPLKRVSQR